MAAAFNIKRPRTPSTSSSSPSTSPAQAPPKAARLAPGESFSSVVEAIPHHPLICTLPPTCDRKPTPIANTNELESHYAHYHAHVCAVKGCRCVFPEERLLVLHQKECHDPIAALRRERGEKIFECHISAPACGKCFSSPKNRRLHLIQAHNYPKEYFFAVTNKGVGGLLKRWGEGASLVRKPWKARESSDAMEDDDSEGDSEEDGEAKAEAEGEDGEATPRMTPKKTLHVSPPSTSQGRPTGPESDVSTLASSMSSLTLIPNTVRFGRGAKTTGGFITRGGKARAKAGGKVHEAGHGAADAMEVDTKPQSNSSLGTASRGKAGIAVARGGGRGGGRGRGKGVRPGPVEGDA